jgi:hypothetical protein
MKNKKTENNQKKAGRKDCLKLSKSSTKHLPKIVGLMLVLAVLYLFKGQFVVATVNGKPITRFSLIKELELQSGKAVLESMIVNNLILQEGKNQAVLATDQQISEEIEIISQSLASQGQNLDVALAAQGMTKKDLEKQLLVQKTAQAIAAKDIEVTDEEIDEYIEENKDYIPSDMEEEEVRESTKQQLTQQKAGIAIQQLVEKLKSEAKINHFFYSE